MSTTNIRRFKKSPLSGALLAVKIGALSLFLNSSVLGPASVQAETVLSTTTASGNWNEDGVLSLDLSAQTGPYERFVTIAFTTGDEAASYQFNSVAYQFLAADADTSGSLSFYLCSYNGNHPPDQNSTILTSLQGNSSPTTAGSYLYTPSNPIQLAASTLYLLVIDASRVNQGAYHMNTTVPTTTPPAPEPSGWAYQELGVNLGGGVWDYRSADNSPRSAPLAIDASAVPEPSSWALLGLGLFLILARCRPSSRPNNEIPRAFNQPAA